MTADHPTCEVDLYQFMRDFHAFDAPKDANGKPIKDDNGKRIDPRPAKLHAAAHAVAFCIASHWNREKREAWPAIETIAFETEISLSTVKLAIKALEDAGWLLVDRRPKPQLHRYRLASPLRAAQSNTDEGMADHRPLNGRSSAIEQPTIGHELRSELTTSTTSEKNSVGAAARVDVLADDWMPNRTHRSTAARLGLDVETLARDFRVAMAGEKREHWDKTFGAYIREKSTDRAEVTFPDPGTAEDPFAPVTTSTVSTTPDTTAQAIEWVTPALWAVGINPDTLTRDERADVVFGQDSGDPHDVAQRIVDARTERHLTNVRKHIGGSLSAEERAFVAECIENGYDAVEDLATDIRNARKGRAVIRNAGGDPAGKSVRELANQYVECIEDEDGEPRSGDPVDHYRALLTA